jgi:PhnB protein
VTIITTTHLNFRGTARRALEFYRSIFGGRLHAATYADLGQPEHTPGADKVVFGLLQTEDGLRLMAYDIPGQDTTDIAETAGTTRRKDGATITDRTFFQSLQGQSLEEVATLWDGLADGADIIEPLAASAWSPGFGMLTDRFGVTWVVDVQATPHG